MAERGSIQRIADATGVNQATVRRALKAAGLTAGRGGFAFADAVAAVEKIADRSKIIGHASNGRGEGGHGVDSFADAKAMSERHRARKLEIQNAQLEASLISREAVTETVTRILADLRVTLMALGVRLAPRVAGATDQKTIARLIEDELRQTLVTFADPDRILSEIEAEALG